MRDRALSYTDLNLSLRALLKTLGDINENIDRLIAEIHGYREDSRKAWQTQLSSIGMIMPPSARERA